jgi:antitoxin ParD1/3/4
VKRSGKSGIFDSLVAWVRRDQRRKLTQQKLVLLLLDGVESGSDPVTAEYWQDLRSSVLGQDG